MKQLKTYLASVALLICSFLSFAQTIGPTTVNSILATVDGESITMADVVRECAGEEKKLASLYGGERLQQERLALRKSVLHQLIFRKLLYREYLKKPFVIPSDTIDDEVNKVLKRVYGDLPKEKIAESLEKSGMTMGKLREEAKVNIAVAVLLQQYYKTHVSITPKEVYEYYEANAKLYEKPKSISFQILQLNKENTRNLEKIEELLPEIKKQIVGANEMKFGQLVEKYSDGSNRTVYGLNSGLEFSKLRPEFQKALDNRKEGEVIGPIDTPDAIFFIRIVEIKAAERKPFEEVSADIETDLKKTKWLEMRNQYEKELRAKSMVQEYI